MPEKKTPFEHESSGGPLPYNRPADTEQISDVVHPRFEERYRELERDDIDDLNKSGHIINPYSEPSSIMWINNDRSIEFHFHKPKPNWWWRMWQYLLLGWRWKNE